MCDLITIQCTHDFDHENCWSCLHLFLRLCEHSRCCWSIHIGLFDGITTAFGKLGVCEARYAIICTHSVHRISTSSSLRHIDCSGPCICCKICCVIDMWVRGKQMAFLNFDERWLFAIMRILQNDWYYSYCNRSLWIIAQMFAELSIEFLKQKKNTLTVLERCSVQQTQCSSLLMIWKDITTPSRCYTNSELLTTDKLRRIVFLSIADPTRLLVLFLSVACVYIAIHNLSLVCSKSDTLRESATKKKLWMVEWAPKSRATRLNERQYVAIICDATLLILALNKKYIAISWAFEWMAEPVYAKYSIHTHMRHQKQ